MVMAVGRRLAMAAVRVAREQGASDVPKGETDGG